jgi:hypothetical protein
LWPIHLVSNLRSFVSQTSNKHYEQDIIMKHITQTSVLIALAMMAFLFPAYVQGATTLAAGWSHVEQIDKNMVLWSWGLNDKGQLSLPSNNRE